MGVIKSGILGGFSGRVGNVVGGSWKGISYMRKLPDSVANPKTTPQTNQRNRFKGVSQFASDINSAIIKPLWDRFAQRESGNNAFVRQNIDNFNTSGVLSAPSTLEISRGKMTATPIATAVTDLSNGNTVVTWNPALLDTFQATTDDAYILLYNITRGQFAFSTTVDRSVGTATVTGAIGGLADVIHVYLAFRRLDGTVVSNTAYLQATVQV
jgi:hypothetical protein